MDSADTADTAQLDEEVDCEQVIGSGCANLRSDAPPPGECRELETGGGQDSGTAVVRGGGPGGSSCAALPSLLPLLVLLFGLLRRRPMWLLLVLLLPSAASAQGVNAQHLRTRDGGSWALLHEARTGPAWTPAVSLASHYGRELVVLEDQGREEMLLEQVLTTELGASLMFSRYIRVGVGIPRHNWTVWRGQLHDSPQLGDLSLWTTIPVRQPPVTARGFEGMALSWTVQTEFATGDPGRYLGDPSGSVSGLLAAEAPLFGPLLGAANVGIKLRSDTSLPGIQWGNRLEYGAGLQTRIGARFFVLTEVQGSTPIRGDGGVAGWPVEAMLSGRAELVGDLALTLGGGSGLTRGLGSPSLRAFAMLDYRDRERLDSDADGIEDKRDACELEPEDRDGWQDRDGCPDEDNDFDGFLDEVDSCPDRPEVFNDYRDRDGCPDRLTTLRLTVLSPDPELEVAELRLGELAEGRILLGEEMAFEVPAATYRLQVQAEGHHPVDLLLDVPHEEWHEHELQLQPVLFARLGVRLQDPQGQALSGWMRGVETGLVEVLPEGVEVELPAGPVQLQLVASGHRPALLELELEADEERVVTLEPSGIELQDGRILLEDTIEFELDQATLLADSKPLLDEVAALLLATPEIQLLRVEGHADEMGSSRYNLELSQARATAVVAYLVEAGVKAERLQPLGTGEAVPREDASQSRRVEFLVLVWDDEAGNLGGALRTDPGQDSSGPGG